MFFTVFCALFPKRVDFFFFFALKWKWYVSNITFFMKDERGYIMKKLICALTAALLLLTGSLGAVLAETVYHCEGYGVGNDVECIIIWSPYGEKMHYGVCHQHVRDKEDPYSYYPVVAYESCTVDSEGTCTLCGRNWSVNQLDPYSLEMLMYLLNSVTRPVDIGVSGAVASVEFSDEFWTEADANGMALGESLMVPTTYTLALIGGKEFAYTGSAITPAVLEVSEYGPGSALTQYGGLEISDIVYTNNVNPGTAGAAVTLSMEDGTQAKIQVTFTITGETEEPEEPEVPEEPEEFTQKQLVDENVALDGSLSMDAALMVTGISAGNTGYDALIKHETAQKMELLAAYDVSLQGKYEGKLKLTFVVGKEHEGKNVTVLHGKKDGQTEVLASVVENGVARVEVSELSPFLILAAKKQDNPTQPTTPPAQPTNPPASTTPPAPTAQPTAVPATGDASQPMLWLAMTLLALTGLIVCVKRGLLHNR